MLLYSCKIPIRIFPYRYRFEEAVMRVYLVYNEAGAIDSVLEKEFEGKFPLSENLCFIKTDKLLDEVINILGFNQEKNQTGIVAKIENINGWYNTSLWDWAKG